MILQTQYFDICLREWPSCCIAAWLRSCWSDAGHHNSWDYGWYVLNFLMHVSKESSLVLLLVALLLLVIAGAGLLQFWCSNILKTMIDRDKICVWDINITFETQYFYFCLTERSSFCWPAWRSSCSSDAGHRFTWDYGWFVLVFLFRHLGNHLWAISFWLSCSLFPTWFVSGKFHLFLNMDMHKFAPCPWTWFLANLGEL